MKPIKEIEKKWRIINALIKELDSTNVDSLKAYSLALRWVLDKEPGLHLKVENRFWRENCNKCGSMLSLISGDI